MAEIMKAHSEDLLATRFGPTRWREPDHYNKLARQRGEGQGPLWADPSLASHLSGTAWPPARLLP